MERRLLVLVSAAGLLAGCASGGPLAKAHGPVFALNSGRWQPTEADYRIGPHPKLPIVDGRAAAKTAKAPTLQSATADVAPVRTSPQKLTAILTNGEPGALGKSGGGKMKAVYVPPLPKLASVKAYRAPAPVKPAVPVPPPPPPLPSWTLAAGKPVGQQLADWAERAGWAVNWDVGKDWTVPRETTLRGQFWTKAPPHGVAGTVISDIATQLVEQGRRPIKARFFGGNKTLVVKRAGGDNS